MGCETASILGRPVRFDFRRREQLLYLLVVGGWNTVFGYATWALMQPLLGGCPNYLVVIVLDLERRCESSSQPVGRASCLLDVHVPTIRMSRLLAARAGVSRTEIGDLVRLSSSRWPSSRLGVSSIST
jgi:hypothetical protein